MRIVFILYSLRSGGAEKQALWLARQCAVRGHTVSVVEVIPARENSRLDGHIEAARRVGVIFYRRPDVGNWWGLVEALNQVMGQRQDAIWTWGFRADIVGLICRVLFEPRFFWIQSLRCADFGDIFRKRYAHAVLHLWGDLIVANSRENISMIERVFRSPCSCVVLRNYVAASRCQACIVLGGSPMIVVMLGNIKIHHKGYDIVLSILGRLRELALPIEIRVAGREDDGGWFRTEIARNGLGNYCKIVGETLTPELFLSEGIAYLLTSRYEGTPNALLEALMAGLPCVVSAVGDVPYLVRDGEHVRIVPIGSVDGFVSAISWIYNNRSDAVEMAARGQAWAKDRFSEDRCRADLYDILGQIESGIAPTIR